MEARILSTSELRSNLARIIDEVSNTDVVVAVGAYRVPRAVIISTERIDRIVERCAGLIAKDRGGVTSAERASARAILFDDIDFASANQPVEGSDRVDYRRRWLYHARLIKQLPTLDWDAPSQNLERVQAAIHGDKAQAALNRWRALIEQRDERGLEDVFLSMTEEADLMRIVSPFAGVLPENERLAVLRDVRRSIG